MRQLSLQYLCERYNQFKYDILDEESDLDDTTTKLSQILNCCSQFKVRHINQTLETLTEGQMSMMFQNIDGQPFLRKRRALEL